MAVIFVYATAADLAEARRIGRVVVEERLAACANIIENMASIYWWRSEVQEAREVVLILKTTDDRFPALVTRVKELHSYDCPCIEALPIVAGFQPFLDWVAQETHVSSAAAKDGGRLSEKP